MTHTTRSTDSTLTDPPVAKILDTDSGHRAAADEGAIDAVLASKQPTSERKPSTAAATTTKSFQSILMPNTTEKMAKLQKKSCVPKTKKAVFSKKLDGEKTKTMHIACMVPLAIVGTFFLGQKKIKSTKEQPMVAKGFKRNSDGRPDRALVTLNNAPAFAEAVAAKLQPALKHTPKFVTDLINKAQKANLMSKLELKDLKKFMKNGELLPIVVVVNLSDTTKLFVSAWAEDPDVCYMACDATAKSLDAMTSIPFTKFLIQSMELVIDSLNLYLSPDGASIIAEPQFKLVDLVTTTRGLDRKEDPRFKERLAQLEDDSSDDSDDEDSATPATADSDEDSDDEKV